MPLIKIRRRSNKVGDEDLNAITNDLQVVAADALTCVEGGKLAPKDITIEVDEVGPYDKNVKDINVRVIAHDYPSRRGEDLATLNKIRRRISVAVVQHLPEGVSWYVWLLLAPTSYGSDTEQ